MGFEITDEKADLGPARLTADGNPIDFGAHDTKCFNCQEEGHKSSECPQPKKMTGACFNCGEVGHSRSDCTKPFSGTCHHCKQEGHSSRECPTRPPDNCRICHQQGHKAAQCTELRVDIYDDLDVHMTAEDAWVAMKKADEEKDLEDFKIAFKAYAKAILDDTSNPDLDLSEMERTFRDEKRNVYLIAKERDVAKNFTIVNVSGHKDQKYVLNFTFSSMPKRIAYAQGWPETPEKNIERLKSCGFIMDRKIALCENCGELGHIRKSCTQEQTEVVDRIEIKCVICDEIGHRARDCTKERYDPFACRNCKQPGHVAADCPEPKSAENVECKACGNMGHFSRDCPDKPKPTCRNCGEKGHNSRDCSEPKKPYCHNCQQVGHSARTCPLPLDIDRVKCNTCGEMGHFSKSCPSGGGANTNPCSKCGKTGHFQWACTADPSEVAHAASAAEAGGEDVAANVAATATDDEW